VTDTWRPFTIRRTVGGDVVRAVTGWQGALRYGPEDVAFDVAKITSLDAIPLGYDTMQITVRIPVLSVPVQEAVLVRGAFGYPTTPLDGVAVWYENVPQTSFPLTSQFNWIVQDTPLTGGYWYYYTLFLSVGTTYGNASWVVGAQVTMLVPRNYQHATRLFQLIPDFYQHTDDEQAADGRNGPLRKYIAIVGYEADNDRTLLDGVLNVYDPDFAPLLFVEYLGTNLGLPIEQALGGARYRSLVGQLSDLENIRGTVPGLKEFIFAASNYECDVVQGGNSMLSSDDAEFVNGVGHWQVFANANVTTIRNYFSGVSPPLDPQTHVVLRVYTGSATPPLPRVPGGGQGIMEVIEI